MTETKMSAAQRRKRVIDMLCNPAADNVFTEEDRVPKRLKLSSPLGSNLDKAAPEKKNDASYALFVNSRLSEQEAAHLPFGRPLLDESEIIQCKHCKKPILRPLAQSHIKACLKVKAEAKKERKLAKEAASGKVDLKKTKEKAEGKEGEDKEEKAKASKPATTGATASEAVKSTTKTATKTKAGAGAKKKAEDEGAAENKNSKKRKATADDDKAKAGEGPKTKKTKKEKPAPKPKGPVDVERQCGVPLPNGQLCARSLTCKSHSMGAKRAVQGRPAPYDTLLLAYQKKNQAKQQKAAINASNPAPDDLETNSLHVDSDEEMEFVMAAVARSNPQPIVPTILLSSRQKYNHRRFTLMLGAALKPPNPPMSAVDARPFGSFSHGFMSQA
ncbi:hypothetical protein TWF173_010725 [Orbilia oligospora]|uniref:SCA7 domain-containing protein n=1 Tax=Orbilia oligospora TaxID=2813651 RepID=A0A7C8VF52_ORBOL|nr:hypothetical protein TWF970_003391 [Orbilia oligospora]KAF3309636.1 hypothetical protein TWF173_010725 [Orbilia oligospora]